jgi:hypothetical protein
LVPTFKLHHYWVKELPGLAERVRSALKDDAARQAFQVISMQAMQFREMRLRDNAVLLLVALFFVARGSAAFGLDNLFK